MVSRAGPEFALAMCALAGIASTHRASHMADWAVGAPIHYTYESRSGLVFRCNHENIRREHEYLSRHYLVWSCKQMRPSTQQALRLGCPGRGRVPTPTVLNDRRTTMEQHAGASAAMIWPLRLGCTTREQPPCSGSMVKHERLGGGCMPMAEMGPDSDCAQLSVPSPRSMLSRSRAIARRVWGCVQSRCLRTCGILPTTTSSTPSQTRTCIVWSSIKRNACGSTVGNRAGLRRRLGKISDAPLLGNWTTI